MSSKVESCKDEDEDISCGLLLRDIEEISKALYLHESPSSYNHRANIIAKTDIPQSKSKVIIQDLSHKYKKPSLWNWKPFKALTSTSNHRFSCCFFLHVHAMEGLPPNFNNLDLCLTWKRDADMLRTCPARVCLGMAEFEETLMHQCTVQCSKTGPHSLVKYEPLVFLLRSSVIDADTPQLDIGNHWIDLSRLLPLTLEELEGGSGKWTTSFKLTAGDAKGATLNVSFGFLVLGGNSFEPGYFMKVPDIVGEGQCRHSQSAEVEFLEEMLQSQGTEFSRSVTLLYQKLDEGKIGIMKEFDLYHKHLECVKPKSDECDNVEFDVIEKGVEKCDFESSVIETIDVAEIFQGDEYFECNSNLDINKHDEDEQKDYSRFIIEPASEGLDSSFYDVSTSEAVEFDSLLDISKYFEQENYLKSSNKEKKLMISLSLDDVAEETIENDFLHMLSFNQSLPRDFSTRSWENPILDNINRKVAFRDDFDLSLAIQSVERNHNNRRNVKMLEILETEALMQEWGLNEAAFQDSPRANSGGFGSPVFLPAAEEPLKLPSIEEGLGPIIQTKDGGFLRSMNPLLFKNANNDARVIVQVSAPVVLPDKMGFNIMEILQCWASHGVEKMCIQVNKLMLLEDVTGKTMQQVLSKAESESDAFKRWESEAIEIQSDCVSIEDLVPMAITNIEGLLVEGLKIQSGMQDQEPPSSIKIHLPEPSSNFGHFLSLEEWIKLDYQEFEIEDESTDENILGKNFIMGFKLQLRDPFRNYETVGPPMLALVRAERVYLDMILEGFDDSEQNVKKIKPMFKISESHLAGLSILHGNNNEQLWGNSRQQQSGSRWLSSSGMAKSNKNHAIFNSTAVIKSSSRVMRKELSGDVLWSISVPSNGEAETWDEHVALNVHVRNPDIIALNVHVRNPDIIFATEKVKRNVNAD